MDNPLIDLKALSEPLTKLIEVVAKGTGALYAPYGTVRQARAEAKARIILAKADEEVCSLQARAANRVEHREAIRQENIEAITVGAARELPKEVSKEPVDTDWTLQFLDCAQDVCDSTMQTLWSRILAGEVASPGSYSKRTIQFLRSLDKWEAEKFSELCAFAFESGEWPVLIQSDGVRKEIAEKLGPEDFIGHFKAIGLLAAEPSMPMASALTGARLGYFGCQYVLQGPPETPKGQLPKFNVVAFRSFTLIGSQLAKIAGAQPIGGFAERVSDYLTAESEVTMKRESN